jgi:hypothetical protein
LKVGLGCTAQQVSQLKQAILLLETKKKKKKPYQYAWRSRQSKSRAFLEKKVEKIIF